MPIRTLAAILLFVSSTALATSPERYFPEDLGQDGRITLAPGFSPDGSTLYFAQSEGSPIWEYPQRLKVAYRTETGWTQPTLVELGKTGRVDEPSVTPDGRNLLFSWSAERPEYAGRDIYENFDLYRLDLTDPDAVPEPFRGSDINRVREGRVAKLRYVHNESAPQITLNGDLYFWGERLDAVGERDIFMAPSDGLGGFGKARPLGAPINTPERENGQWVDPTGSYMIVGLDRASTGQRGLHLSRRTATGWSDPVSLGEAVNGSGDNFAGRVTPDGSTLVFNSTRAFDDQPEGLIQLWSIPVVDIPVLKAAVED